MKIPVSGCFVMFLLITSYNSCSAYFEFVFGGMYTATKKKKPALPGQIMW